MRFSLIILIFLVGLPVSFAQHTSASKNREYCAQHADQDFPFDGRRIRFGGFETGSGVLYCVVVDEAAHEYRIDWPHAKIRNVATIDGIQYSRPGIPPPRISYESAAYVGANRIQFDVWIPRQDSDKYLAISGVQGNLWSIYSYLFGGLPVSGDEVLYKPLYLEIEARVDEEGACIARVADLLAPEREETIRFRLPETVIAGAIDDSAYVVHELSAEPEAIIYQFEAGRPVAVFAALEITDEAENPIAEIPAILCSYTEEI